MFGLAKRKDIEDLESKVAYNLEKNFGLIKQDVNVLRNYIQSNKEEITKLKEKINELRSKSVLRSKVRSKVRTKLRSKKKAYADNKIIKKYKATKPNLIMDAIDSLLSTGVRTSDIEDIVVEEKQLCSKTSFYKYLGLLRSKIQSELRSKSVLRSK